MMIDKKNLMKEKAGISYLEILILILSVFAFSYIIYSGFEEIESVKAEEYKQGEIIVGFNDNVTREQEEILVKSFNLILDRCFTLTNACVVKVPAGEEQKWIGTFEKERIVKYAELNYEVKTQTETQNYNQTLTERTISEQNASWNCCLENKQNAICQDVPSGYNDCKVNLLPTQCKEVSSCKLGCCFNNNEGLCSPNSPKQKCESEKGVWKDNAVCNVEECRLGCCILGQNTEFVTEKRCEKLSAFYGFGLDFRGEINSELGCLALSYSQAKGACVIEGENEGEIERGCKFVSKQECLRLTGNLINFFENKLCSNPGLNTTCTKTKETACVENKDEVYFLDSCGNIANIYDVSKIDNAEYWNRIYEKNESCDLSFESKSCGNCNRFSGSFCGEGQAELGNRICKSLDCKNAPALVDASGKVLKSKDKKNGEAWCVYDSYIGEGKDVVGSRHFKYYCLDGEIKIEPCADFRQEVCVSSEIKNEGKSFSSASCRVNRWRECLDYNNLAEKQGDKINYDRVKEKCQENSDCYVKELNFGKGYHFFQCLPNYPSGFNLESERGSEINEKVCSMANFDCVKIEVKTLSGWKCVAGCECTSKKYTQQMNDWCISLGDCGGYVNILGREDDAYSIKKAPKIDLGQYQKFINPVEGKKAEPGDISELLLGQMGLGLGEEGYIPEEQGLGSILTNAVRFKGVELAAIFATSNIFKPSWSMAQAWDKIPLIGAKITVQNFWVGFGNQLVGGLAGSVAGYLVAKMFGLKGQAVGIVSAVGGIAGGWAVLSGTQISAGASVAGSTISSGSIAVAQGVASTTLTAGSGGATLSIGGTTIPIAAGQTTTIAAGQTAIITQGTIAAGEGAVAGAEGAGVPIFGIDPITILIAILIIILVAIIMKVLGIGETRETHAIFKCYPWEAPTGGGDCEKINNKELKTGSKYRCSSLGQACELINEGTLEEKCFWNNKNDVSSPIINPWKEILTPGFKYEVNENGFKIKTENNECIQAFTPLMFGISANELSQCKFDTTNLGYDEMEDYFGLDNLYRQNHSMPFTIPSAEAFANEFNLTYQYVLDKIGEMRFYIKCQDKNGNKNINPYLVDICVKSGPDKTAPMILGAIPASGSYVKFNTTSQEMVLFVNEPSECKYSLQDKSYEQMDKGMSCLTGLQQASAFGWSCNSTLDLSKNSSFYFKCKDQPWLAGTANESNRNTNQQSFVYELKKSVGELKITKIEPNGTIKAGVEPFSVLLKAQTSGGAEQGKATCSFKFSSEGTWIGFFETFSNEHKQIFNQMLQGEHNIYVKCEDITGNKAESSTSFKLEIDNKAPKIIRVYNSGMLKIITDEDAECVYSNSGCGFVWENATRMSGLLREHETTWVSGASYYIKCKDLWNNKPDNCFIVKAI